MTAGGKNPGATNTPTTMISTLATKEEMMTNIGSQSDTDLLGLPAPIQVAVILDIITHQKAKDTREEIGLEVETEAEKVTEVNLKGTPQRGSIRDPSILKDTEAEAVIGETGVALGVVSEEIEETSEAEVAGGISEVEAALGAEAEETLRTKCLTPTPSTKRKPSKPLCNSQLCRAGTEGVSMKVVLVNTTPETKPTRTPVSTKDTVSKSTKVDNPNNQTNKPEPSRPN